MFFLFSVISLVRQPCGWFPLFHCDLHVPTDDPLQTDVFTTQTTPLADVPTTADAAEPLA